MDNKERAGQLKQTLIDFVFDAEGDLAIALEKYIAENASKDTYDSTERDLLLDTFACQEKVGENSVLQLYIDSQDIELSSSEKHLILGWKDTFTGLFTIEEILPNHLILMNWLTAKNYQVFCLHDISKLKVGDIILTRIAPISSETWLLSTSYTQMGKLGKPKLAVAIGNFNKNYKPYLYSDAPELLAEAWKSVSKYHQEFVDFFGSEIITLSGYELNKKFTKLQEILSEKQLAAAGIDGKKNIAEIVQSSGIDANEVKSAAEAAGVEKQVVDQLFTNPQETKMVMPKVELPAHLKKAEQVTALSNPLWGQMFLVNYPRLKTLLTAPNQPTPEDSQKLVKKALEDPEMNAFAWQHLAQAYPQPLEKLLQTFLNRPNFQISQDLDKLLTEYGKPLEPELPEIASVPIHLHNLFQEALAEVNKTETKNKATKKPTKGFLKTT